MIYRALTLVCVVLTLVACGGSSPVTPTAIAAWSVLSGLDETVVPGADVSGKGVEITISAPEFLTIDTLRRDRPAFLWPNNSQITLEDTYSFVYGSNDGNPLRRIGDSTRVVSVVPGPGIRNDPRSMDALQAGVGMVNQAIAAAAIPVRYAVDDPSGQIRVDIDINPGDPGFQTYPEAAALAYSHYENNVTVGARIPILNLHHARLPVLIAHELMHVFGFGHSVHEGPMLGTAQVYAYNNFQLLDILYIRLLRTRQPGNRIVFSQARESDRSALSSSGVRRSTETFVCPQVGR